eukprot:scaffold1996_cov377-Prasinococcus_capsulatus_cf.AAC.12
MHHRVTCLRAHEPAQAPCVASHQRSDDALTPKGHNDATATIVRMSSHRSCHPSSKLALGWEYAADGSLFVWGSAEGSLDRPAR